MIPRLKLNILSCSRPGDYRVTATFEKGKNNLIDRRQNGELFGDIAKRSADGQFAAKLRVPQTGNKIILMDPSQGTEGDDDINSTMTEGGADELRLKRLALESPLIVREMIRSGKYGMNPMDREHR